MVLQVQVPPPELVRGSKSACWLFSPCFMRSVETGPVTDVYTQGQSAAHAHVGQQGLPSTQRAVVLLLLLPLPSIGPFVRLGGGLSHSSPPHHGLLIVAAETGRSYYTSNLILITLFIFQSKYTQMSPPCLVMVFAIIASGCVAPY